MEELINEILYYNLPDDIEMIACFEAEYDIKLICGYKIDVVTFTMYFIATKIRMFFLVCVDNDESIYDDILARIDAKDGFEKVVEWMQYQATKRQ